MRGHFKEVVFGASCYAALLCVWQFVVAPMLPPTGVDNEAYAGRPFWEKPHGFYMTQGDVKSAETLFIGDSRVRSDILIPEMLENDVDACAVLWGPAVRLAAILPAAHDLPATRVIVCLSALSLDVPARGAVKFFERGEAPPIARGAGEKEEAEWEERRIQEFVAAGLKRVHVEKIVRGLVGLYRELNSKFGWTPSAIDERLGLWLDKQRQAWIRGVSTGTWRSSWFQVFDETLSNDEYSQRLRNWTDEDFEKTKSIIVEVLVRLREEGRTVICVRLPISDSLHEIESRVLLDEAFGELCRDAGVPFLDYSSQDYQTLDGSHLIPASAAEFARVLAADLRRLGGQ